MGCERYRGPSRSKDALRMTARTNNDEGQATARAKQRLSGAAFGGEDFLFAVEAPAVAGEAAVLGDGAVAWDGESNGVGGTGGGDGAGGGGRAERAGESGVAARLAAGDLLEGSPDTLLEGGGADVEGEGGGQGVFGGLAEDEGESFGEPSGVSLGGDELGLIEALAEIGGEFGVVAAEGDGADSGIGGGGQHPAQRAGGRGVTDEETCAAGAESAGSHSEGVAAGLVEAAGGAEAGLVDGVCDARGSGQRFAGTGGGLVEWLR